MNQSQSLRAALDQAGVEAKAMGDSYLSSFHVLLGMLSAYPEHSIAAKALQTLGVTYPDVKRAILDVLAASSGKSQPAPEVKVLAKWEEPDGQSIEPTERTAWRWRKAIIRMPVSGVPYRDVFQDIDCEIQWREGV